MKKLLTSLKKKNEGKGCFVCGKVISNPTLLAQHERSHFRSLECISYNCSLCSKSFNNFQAMVTHRMEHEKLAGATPKEPDKSVDTGTPSELPMPSQSETPSGQDSVQLPDKPKKRRTKPKVGQYVLISNKRNEGMLLIPCKFKKLHFPPLVFHLLSQKLSGERHKAMNFILVNFYVVNLLCNRRLISNVVNQVGIQELEILPVKLTVRVWNYPFGKL